MVQMMNVVLCVFYRKREVDGERGPQEGQVLPVAPHGGEG